MLRAICRSGVVTLACLLVAPTAVHATRADLAKARALYNQGEFDGAIDAATAARQTPATADAAAIVLARSHLERYRERADPADLSAAREALGAIRSQALDQRDRLEFLLAIGESLFLEDDFGASAQTFEIGLERAAAADPLLHESMLDWWGSAVERQAGMLPRDSRVTVFERLSERMLTELAKNPTSLPATYWSIVAFRGAGEVDRAWHAAVAAWVRARLLGDRAASLRADVDSLVQRGIIPDRVRQLPADQRARAEAELRAEWELTKAKWK
jgi:hypothetical protein